MSKVIAVHSFRHSTGKSTVVANLAAVLAQMGLRVAVVDLSFESPSMHMFLSLDEDKLIHTLNDFLWEECSFAETVYDVNDCLGISLTGRIFLVPASPRISDIMRYTRKEFDYDRLGDGLLALDEKYSPDVILLDTSAGLTEETLISIAFAQTALILLRPEQQDYQGSAVTLEVARKLDIPNLYLVLSNTPTSMDMTSISEQMKDIFGCPVLAALPHSDELVVYSTNRFLAVERPTHPWSMGIRQLALQVAG